MSETRALHVAMTALSAHHHHASLTPEDRSDIEAVAPEALAVLMGLQNRLEQNPTQAHLARCAVCGTPPRPWPQYPFGVDELTGQFHRVDDLAVCAACVNVLRDSALKAARAKGWTRAGARPRKPPPGPSRTGPRLSKEAQ